MSLSFSVGLEKTPQFDTLSLPAGAAGKAWFHRSSSGPFPFHRHSEHEMNLVVSGEASYLVADRDTGSARRHVLTRSSLIWLYPTEDHLLLEPSSDFSMWITVWTPDTVARLAALPLAGPRTATVGDTALSRIEGVLADIADAEKTGDDQRRDLGYSYLLLAARAIHVQARGSGDSAPRIHSAVARIARLLREETEPFTMQELAREAGSLSASRLARLFTEQMGVGIGTFRNRERLERFRRRRVSPQFADETLIDAALASGFGSYAQFHRVYTAASGHPPSRGPSCG